MEYKQKANIKIPHDLKGLLDNIKIHPKERYEDVIRRLSEQVIKTIDQITNEKEVKKDGRGISGPNENQ